MGLSDGTIRIVKWEGETTRVLQLPNLSRVTAVRWCMPGLLFTGFGSGE